jgi:hypothetical protein
MLRSRVVNEHRLDRFLRRQSLRPDPRETDGRDSEQESDSDRPSVPEKDVSLPRRDPTHDDKWQDDTEDLPSRQRDSQEGNGENDVWSIEVCRDSVLMAHGVIIAFRIMNAARM